MNNENFNAEAYAQDAPAFLGKHEYARLREAIHTSQLGIFQGVFLRSLRVLHETLREIPVEGQDSMNLFDLKINELSATFKHLNNLPELYSKESETFRNIAVTAFTFYRVLYKGIYAAFLNYHKTQAHFEIDPFILYKRIPYKLYEFLGGQYWRIYEFYEVVEGDLVKLKLNADIKDFITQACVENKSTPQPTKPLNISEAVSNLSEETKRLQMKLVESESALQQLEREFNQWLQKQLDQDLLHINERGIYSSRLKYGTDLFVEEGILVQFVSFYQKDLKVLKQVLKTAAEEKTYSILIQRKVIEVYRIKGLEFIDNEFNPQKIKEEN